MRSVLVLVIGTLILASCNTVEGVGRDIQGAGKAVEKGAKKVKDAVTD